ncbi:MAG: hypothetical protein ACI9WO_001315 [Sphingobacteriales bacterium]|jgi:hypothetical protein
MNNTRKAKFKTLKNEKIIKSNCLSFPVDPEACGQEVFFKIGKNVTTCDFQFNSGSDIMFGSGRRYSYEFSIGFPFAEKAGAVPTRGLY